MHLEPIVILQVDRSLAQFIVAARPPSPTQATERELGRWLAAQEVRRILRDACPYEAASAAGAAWFKEKYGDDADAVMKD